MKAVVVQQLGAAVLQNFVMYRAILQRLLESTCSGACSVEGDRSIRVAHLPVLPYIEAYEGQGNVQFAPTRRECRVVSDIAHRVHSGVDESDEVVADPVLVLSSGESVEQTLPLGIARVYIGDANLLE
jgi:hypothetical protein